MVLVTHEPLFFPNKGRIAVVNYVPGVDIPPTKVGGFSRPMQKTCIWYG